MKKALTFATCSASAILLTACSITLPVQGQMQGSPETFTGTATGYLNRSGILEVKTTSGAICKGKFVYIDSRQGNGVFTCNDGRNGPFEFTSTGRSGLGVGSLGDRKLTFTFGD